MKTLLYIISKIPSFKQTQTKRFDINVFYRSMDDVRRQLQMKENKKSKKRRIFQVFLLMICSAILYVSYAAYDIWSYRFKTDDDVKTDAGIVLGAASWNGKPSPVFKERINHAIYIKTETLRKLFLQVVQSLKQSLRKLALLEYMH